MSLVESQKTSAPPAAEARPKGSFLSEIALNMWQFRHAEDDRDTSSMRYWYGGVVALIGLAATVELLGVELP